jgi:hypothetical protein
LGALSLIAVRFATFKDDRVHFHANFALYINGVRDEFKSSTFYEETQSCSADAIGPKSRVHMHDQESSVVHVHENGATWGHFFANLGYGLTNKSVVTDAGVFVDGEKDTKIEFLLNGERVESIANEPIGNEDTLIVWVGKSTDTFTLPQLPNDAKQHNEEDDPAACSGSEPITFTERLKKSIGIGE